VSANHVIKLNHATVTLPFDVAVGDLIVLVVGAFSNVHALTFTSPRTTGNFTLVCNSDITKSNFCAIYAKVATSAGACTVTCASGGGSFSQLWAGTILSGILPADVTAVAYSNAGSAGNTATPVVTTGTNRVIVAGVVGFHSATVFAAVGSSHLIFDYIGGSDAMGVMVMNAPTAGSYTPVISQSDRDNNPLCIAAFSGSWPPTEGVQVTTAVVEPVSGAQPTFMATGLVVEIIRSTAEITPPVVVEEGITPLYDSCNSLSSVDW